MGVAAQRVRRHHDRHSLTSPHSPFVTALPNLISLARLLAVPLAIWLILQDRYGSAFWVFAAAGASDALDGFIAKQFGLRTVLGGFLDPLADKALLMSVYVTLGYRGQVDTWLVILIVSRDVLIIGGAILYQTVTQSLTMQPLLVSKINTAAQIGLVVLVLAKLGLGMVHDYGIIDAMVAIVAATTVLSGGAYVAIWGWRIFRMQDTR
jgi:cardiolipin synthase (CMP-forming)